MVPSVSGQEMEHYKRVQAEFSPAEAQPKTVPREEPSSRLDRLGVVVGGSGREEAPMVNGKGKGKARA